MNLIAFATLPILLGAPQAAPLSQSGRDCVVNVNGKNNTATVTCRGVDKELAKTITQLVGDSKRNSSTLAVISSHLASLLKEVKDGAMSTRIEQGSGSVASVNQSGGITVGQMNVVGPGPVKVHFSNVLQSNAESLNGVAIFKTVFRVTFSGQIPRFDLFVLAPELTDIDFLLDGVSMMSIFKSTAPDGTRHESIEQVFGSGRLTIITKTSACCTINFGCVGVACILEP